MANQTILGLTTVAPQTTLGTAATSGFLTLESLPVFPNTQREMFPRNTLRGAFYDPRPLEGKQSGMEFSIGVQALHGSSSSIPSADAVANADITLFKSLLGTLVTPSGYNAGAVVASGSTASAIKIDSGVTSSTFKPGTALVFSDGGSPATYAMGWVVSVTDGGGSNHTITLFQALPFTPGDGTTVWSTATAYSSTTAPPLVTVRAQSSESTSRMEMEGCVVIAAKLGINPGGEIGCEFTLKQNAIASSSTALTDYAYTNPALPPAIGANGAKLVLGGSSIDVNTLDITISANVIGAASHSGTQGLGSWIIANRTIEVDVTRYVAGAAPVSTLPAVSSMLMQFGTTPGNMMGILLPVVDLHEWSAPQDRDGFWEQSFKYKANRYAGDTATDAGNSAWRVAIS